MAKKTRRSRRSAAITPKPVEEQLVGAPAPAADSESSGLLLKPERDLVIQKAAVNFRAEYKYVVSDIRRFAILTTVMFALLIALAFILPAVGL